MSAAQPQALLPTLRAIDRASVARDLRLFGFLFGVIDCFEPRSALLGSGSPALCRDDFVVGTVAGADAVGRFFADFNIEIPNRSLRFPGNGNFRAETTGPKPAPNVYGRYCRAPLRGNGIFSAETKGPKRPRRFKDAGAETKSARQLRQFGANPPSSGKSPLARECVVGLRGLELRARHAVLSNRSLSLPQCCKRGRIAPSQK